MAGALSQKKQRQLALSMARMVEKRSVVVGEIVRGWHRRTASLDLDFQGFYALRDAIEGLQSVEAWREAYPFDVLADRVADSILETTTIEEAIAKLLAGLSEDCKELLAYRAIFGFNMVDGASIAFNKSVLATLGEERVNAEIIGRLSEHIANLGEPLRSAERKRFEKYVEKHKAVPVLFVPFFGSTDGAPESVRKLAERVAAFMQFAIGVLTDQNTHVIDDKGRFTGEYMVHMPVMTPTFDQISFPNVRENPHRISIGPSDIKRLSDCGVLALTTMFISPSWGTTNSIDTLIARAINCFSDGERGVTDLARIVSYAAAIDVFFSSSTDRTGEAFALGVAAATNNEHQSFQDAYAMGKAIYDQRSRAVHDGIEPTFMWPARIKARQTILSMISMRGQLTHKPQIAKWVSEENVRLNAGSTDTLSTQ